VEDLGVGASPGIGGGVLVVELGGAGEVLEVELVASPNGVPHEPGQRQLAPRGKQAEP